MNKLINGLIVEMTAEEIEAAQNDQQNGHNESPTMEERLDALEEALMELVEVVVSG